MAEADPSPHQLKCRLELVRAHVDCENRHDFEGILQTFGTAIAYEDQAWRTRYPGSEGVRLYYEEFLHACADLRIEVHAEHVCTDTIVLEVTISGTHTGSWHGLPATFETDEHLRFPRTHEEAPGGRQKKWDAVAKRRPEQVLTAAFGV
jgi:hypothetical protein